MILIWLILTKKWSTREKSQFVVNSLHLLYILKSFSESVMNANAKHKLMCSPSTPLVDAIVENFLIILLCWTCVKLLISNTRNSKQTMPADGSSMRFSFENYLKLNKQASDEQRKVSTFNLHFKWTSFVVVLVVVAACNSQISKKFHRKISLRPQLSSFSLQFSWKCNNDCSCW